jgi:hypothetical protein
MFKSEKCTENSSISCYDLESLLIIANALNNIGYKININVKNKKTLYNKIKKILNEISNCKDEECWLKINGLIDILTEDQLKKLKANFKPQIPISWDKNKDEWLSTVDIDKILNRYKYTDKNFHSFGAIPIDSLKDDVCTNDLCDFDLNKFISEDKYKIGIVYNTEKHNEDGQHWIGLYLDLKGLNFNNNPCIYFFDSYGEKPPEQVNKFSSEVISQGKDLNIEIDYAYNDKQHQSRGGECGVYCLHFLTYMKNGGNFDKYISEKKDDDYMHKFRYYFYQ